jgi:uroporphyrinogen III methyltransferase/synthase
MSDPPSKAHPLSGRRIAVAGSRSKLSSFEDALTRLGATVLLLPVIELHPLADTGEVDGSIRRLTDYDWVVFTSSHGVRFFMDRVRAVRSGGFPPRRPGVCAIGPGTARDLAEVGVVVDLIPQTFNSEGVLSAIVRTVGGPEHLPGIAVLLPRAREGREFLPVQLAAAGCIVTEVACYESAPSLVPLEDLRVLSLSPPDVLVLTSPSAVRSLLSQAEREGLDCPSSRTVVAALGPLTAAAAEKAGRRVSVLPTHNTIESLIESIVRSIPGS